MFSFLTVKVLLLLGALGLGVRGWARRGQPSADDLADIGRAAAEVLAASGADLAGVDVFERWRAQLLASLEVMGFRAPTERALNAAAAAALPVLLALVAERAEAAGTRIAATIEAAGAGR